MCLPQYLTPSCMLFLACKKRLKFYCMGNRNSLDESTFSFDSLYTLCTLLSTITPFLLTTLGDIGWAAQLASAPSCERGLICNCQLIVSIHQREREREPAKGEFFPPFVVSLIFSPRRRIQVTLTPSLSLLLQETLLQPPHSCRPSSFLRQNYFIHLCVCAAN